MIRVIRGIDPSKVQQIPTEEEWQGMIGYDHEGMESLRGNNWMMFIRMVADILKTDPMHKITITREDWEAIIKKHKNHSLESVKNRKWLDWILMTNNLIDVVHILTTRHLS